MLTKTQAQHLSTRGDFERADAAFREISTRRSNLEKQAAAILLARQLAENPALAKRVPQDLQEAARPYAALADRPAALAVALENCRAELADVVRTFGDALQEWERARRAETTRRALELVPEHHQALLDVGDALSSLSRAIGAERAIRRQLKDTSPYRQSPFLPTIVEELLVGEIGEPGSPAQKFAKAMRKSGLVA